MLFLGTSVVQPMEGPYVSGIINTLRALGTVVGSGLIGQFLYSRRQFHHENLVGHTADSSLPLTDLAIFLNQQATVLATADIYRVFAVIALLLIPVVLILQYIPAPPIKRASDAKP